MEALIFYLLAIGAVICGILVIVKKNPVINALFLILVMLCLAGIFLLLGAQFMAAIQLIVYAGAIMVLFLFVIMLLNLDQEISGVVKGGPQKAVGFILAVLLLAVLLSVVGINQLPGKGLHPIDEVSNTESLARVLFTHFLLPFEITSVILLIAIIGAIVLGKKKL
jgi:NADH-quinone oxidoreductase subunit J